MKIVSARSLGKMPVYDLAVDHPHHSFRHQSGAVLHNCAFVIANRPVHEFIPLTRISGVPVTQYTAGSVEASGGVKMDFLVVNSLRDIGYCLKLIQQRSGVEPQPYVALKTGQVPWCRVVPHKGKLLDVWDLPSDQSVFADVASGRTETVFQFNTEAAKGWLQAFNHKQRGGRQIIDSVAGMAAFTALDRPGPLDAMVGQGEKEHNMLQEYAVRARGLDPTDEIPALTKLLPETYGVMVYQEQLQKIYQYLTGCTGSEAEEFRSNVAKKKMAKVDKAYPGFIEKASAKIGEDVAKQLWSTMVTWGQYGFNKSHAVCYALIAYGCSWLKHHHPLEWWTAVLRNADKNEIAEEFWQYCSKWVDMPDVQLSGDNFELHGNRIKAPLSLIDGVGPGAQEELTAGRPYADMDDFCAKIVATKVRKTTMMPNGKPRKGTSALNRGVVTKLIVTGVLDALFPAGTSELEKFQGFATAMAKAAGKKKPEPVDPRVLDMDPLDRYQFKKSVLPIYAEDLRDPVAHLWGSSSYKGTVMVDERGDTVQRYGYWHEDSCENIAVVTVPEIEKLRKAPVKELRLAVVGYVMSAEDFRYTKKDTGEQQRATKMVIDIAGRQREYVKWPSKRGPALLPRGMKVDQLPGSIVLAVLSRWGEGRDFSLESIEVVRPPEIKKEESA